MESYIPQPNNREGEARANIESLKEFFAILDEYRRFNTTPSEEQWEAVKIPLDQRLSRIQPILETLGLQLEMFDKKGFMEPGFSIKDIARFETVLGQLSHQVSDDQRDVWINLLRSFHHQALFDYKHDESDERLEDFFLASESIIKHVDTFSDTYRPDGQRDGVLQHFRFNMSGIIDIMRKGWLKEYKIMYPSGIFYRISQNAHLLPSPTESNYQHSREGGYESFNRSCLEALKQAMATGNPNAAQDLATYALLFRGKLLQDKSQLDVAPYPEEDKVYFKDLIEKLDAELQKL